MPKPQLEAPTIPTAFIPDFVKWGEDTVRVCQCYGTPELEMAFLMDIFLKALDSNFYYHSKHTHAHHLVKLLHESLHNALDKYYLAPLLTIV